ncbi:MAG UNVERIFIED_CONTAM: hypothetical protein LVR18_36565 [Planctomycetaceae bacterium]
MSLYAAGCGSVSSVESGGSLAASAGGQQEHRSPELGTHGVLDESDGRDG